MFCPNCGTELADGVKFCPNCGNKIASIKQGEQYSESQTIPASPIERKEVQTTTKSYVPKKKSILKKWWFWVAAILVISLIMPTGRKKTSSKDPGSTAQSTVAVSATVKPEETTKALPTQKPMSMPTPAPTPKPTPVPTQKPAPKQSVSMTLNEGKYIIGEEIEPGTYIITCIKTDGDTYNSTYSAIGDLYGSMGAGDDLSGMMNSLGGMMGDLITASVSVLGDYGSVIKSFEMKTGDSVTITLNEKTALQIEYGTCTLESK